MSRLRLRLLGAGIVVLVAGLAAARFAECAERIAVLEFRSSGSSLPLAEREYLVDSVVRGAVRQTLPTDRYLVMTKESMIELLQEQKIDFESVCEGACELEVGRKIQAHYIVTGAFYRVGGRHQVVVKLHDTKSGNMLAQETVSAADAESLSGTLSMATRAILAGLLAAAPAAPAPSARSAAQPGGLAAGGTSGSGESAAAVVAGSGPTEGMVLIPGGTFWMGCVPGDGECDDDERPRHQVTVSPFWMDVFEVTVAQYGECVNAGVCRTPYVDPKSAEFYNWGKAEYGSHPVNGVSWNDAVTYCEWRGKRLPTEAEFEYALRGGRDGGKYPWGWSELPPGVYGNYGDESAKRVFKNVEGAKFFDGYDDGYVGTSPVGIFPANAYGLFDVSGNVWEWCWDWYDEDYYGRSPSKDPRGPDSGTTRVLRGGSWDFRPWSVRASLRTGTFRASGTTTSGSAVLGTHNLPFALLPSYPLWLRGGVVAIFWRASDRGEVGRGHRQGSVLHFTDEPQEPQPENPVTSAALGLRGGRVATFARGAARKNALLPGSERERFARCDLSARICDDLERFRMRRERWRFAIQVPERREGSHGASALSYLI